MRPCFALSAAPGQQPGARAQAAGGAAAWAQGAAAAGAALCSYVTWGSLCTNLNVCFPLCGAHLGASCKVQGHSKHLARSSPWSIRLGRDGPSQKHFRIAACLLWQVRWDRKGSIFEEGLRALHKRRAGFSSPLYVILVTCVQAHYCLPPLVACRAASR